MANERRKIKTVLLKNDSIMDFYKESQYSDTEVRVNDKLLCWISWESNSKFTQELIDWIEKYSI